MYVQPKLVEGAPQSHSGTQGRMFCHLWTQWPPVLYDRWVGGLCNDSLCFGLKVTQVTSTSCPLARTSHMTQISAEVLGERKHLVHSKCLPHQQITGHLHIEFSRAVQVHQAAHRSHYLLPSHWSIFHFPVLGKRANMHTVSSTADVSDIYLLSPTLGHLRELTDFILSLVPAYCSQHTVLD